MSARTIRDQKQRPSIRRLAPRKLPRQKRSQILFDKILSTAKSLFEREGYAYVSTNRIADAANISVGSLYQYFANCESIALAIYQDAASRAALTVKRKAVESLSLSLKDSTFRSIECVVDVFERDRYALLQLINEVPELRRVSQPFSFDSLIHQPTQMYLEQHFTHVDRRVIARKCYLIETCVIGAISRYLDERPDFLSRSELIEEITELLQQYLATISGHPIAVPVRRTRRTDDAAGPGGA